ncbi:hypothetical protein [Paenibacillus glycanilyticus]|uniref:hypothetical protein n=1 Tax=Paenibacillus glycanilyticus TaxID=126569 RepID=UPI003EB6A1B7
MIDKTMEQQLIINQLFITMETVNFMSVQQNTFVTEINQINNIINVFENDGPPDVATATSLTVPTAGDYTADWSVSFLPPPTHCAFGIFINGTLHPATTSGLAVTDGQQVNDVGATAIMRLGANDVVELRALIPATSTQTAINISAVIQYPPFGGVADQPIASASLRIIKLTA